MRVINSHIGKKYPPNLLIGGAGDLVTPSILASSIQVSPAKLKNFIVDSKNNISCHIIGNFNLATNSFNSTNYANMTHMIDLEDRAIGTGSNPYVSRINLKYTYSGSAGPQGRGYQSSSLEVCYHPNATTINQRAFLNCFNLHRIYTPRCTSVSATGPFDNTWASMPYTVYVDPILATSNGGNPDAQIQNLIDWGNTVIYVDNFNTPGAVTGLDYYNNPDGTTTLDFTPPSSPPNALDFYEVWLSHDNGYSWYWVGEVKESGDSINLGLNDGDNVMLKIRAADIYYNLGPWSNELTFEFATPDMIFLGVGTELNTPALMASKLTITESNIQGFFVKDNDVYFKSTAVFSPVSNATWVNIEGVISFGTNFQNWGYRSFYNEGSLIMVAALVSTYGTQMVREGSSVKYLRMDNVTSIPSTYQNFDSVGNSGRIWIPRCTSLGDPATNGPMFHSGVLNGVIYVDPSLLTANGGGMESDLQWAIDNRSATVVGVQNFTAPLAVTNLSVSRESDTTARINFDQPLGSTNDVDFYEVWIDDGSGDPIQLYTPYQEISGSGELVTGLDPAKTYKFKVTTCDIYWNRSVDSDTALEFNTFLGGISNLIVDEQAFVDEFVGSGITASQIENFTIEGNNVKMKITGNYILQGYALQNNTDFTYFIDLESKVTATGGWGIFGNCSNLKFIHIPGSFSWGSINQSSTGFSGLTGLIGFNAPGATGFHLRTFNAPNLRWIRFPNVTTMDFYSTIQVIFSNACERFYVPLWVTADVPFSYEDTRILNTNPPGCKIYHSTGFGVANRKAFNYVLSSGSVWSAGDTIVINGLTYTAIAGTPTQDGEFDAGSTWGGTTGLVNAINSDGRTGTLGTVTAQGDFSNLGLETDILGAGGNATLLGAISSSGTHVKGFDPNFVGGNDVFRTLLKLRDVKGAILVEKTDSTLPTEPTNVLAHVLDSNTLRIEFTAPTPNVNGTDSYEVYIDNGTDHRRLFKYDEILASGDDLDITEVLTDGVGVEDFKITLRTLDNQGNVSPDSLVAKIFNTYVENVGASYIVDAAELATRSSLSESDIYHFDNDGTDIRFLVAANWNWNDGEFTTNNVKKFLDIEGFCRQSSAQNVFQNANLLTHVYAKNLFLNGFGDFSLYDSEAIEKVDVENFTTVNTRGFLRDADDIKLLYLPNLNSNTYNGNQSFCKGLDSLEVLYIPLWAATTEDVRQACMIRSTARIYYFQEINPACKVYINSGLGVANRNAYCNISSGWAQGDTIEINGLTYTCIAGVPTVDGEFQNDGVMHPNTVHTNLKNAINADTRIGTFSTVTAYNDNAFMAVQCDTTGTGGDSVTVSLGGGNTGTATIVDSFRGGNDVHPMILNMKELGCTIIEVGAPISVDPPTAVSVEKIGSKTAVIRLTPPTTNANGTEGYEVWLDDGSVITRLFRWDQIEGDESFIQGLTPQTTYKMKLRTIDGDFNYSAFTSEVEFTTPEYTYIADMFPEMEVAYGLKKMRSAQVYGIRMERPSDNAQTDVELYDDPTLTIDLNSPVSAGGILGDWLDLGVGYTDFVVTVYDQSGNGNDITGSFLGITYNGALNGNVDPYTGACKIRTGSSDKMNLGSALSAFDDGNDFTVYGCAQMFSVQVGSIFRTSADTNNRYHMYLDKTASDYGARIIAATTNADCLLDAGFDNNTNNYRLQITTVDGTAKSMKFYRGSVLDDTETWSGTYVNSDVIVGSDGGAASFNNGGFIEIVAFNANLDKLVGYIANLFNERW